MGVPTTSRSPASSRSRRSSPMAPALAVTGVIEDEAVAELAFHRDGGRIPVMRGRVGAPVLVADRRLIAAGL